MTVPTVAVPAELLAGESDATQAPSSGAMIALYPPADVASALAQPDGEPAEDLHLTLVYLGTSEQVDATDTGHLISVLQDVSMFSRPIDGEVSGIARFYGAEADGRIPAVALVDAQGLGAFRSLLVEALESIGITTPSVHDFIPHITLDYQDPDEPMPTLQGLPLPINFRELYLVNGDVKTPFELGHPFSPVRLAEGWNDPLTGGDLAAGIDPDAWGAAIEGLTDDVVNNGDVTPICVVCGQAPVDDSHGILSPVFQSIQAAGTCAGPGPCDVSPLGLKHNWVTARGGLPVYIRAIAHALTRSGRSETSAIQMAIGTVKRWAAGGGKVSAAVRARAAAALAQWEAMKGSSGGARAVHAAGGVPTPASPSSYAGPPFAGVALKAADTGRVLMLQRGLGDESDPAAGQWEFPGGAREPGDSTSLHTGIREWQEEVGQRFPEGGVVAHTWTAPNKKWQGHIVVIPEEKAVCLHQGRDLDNPDDPDGDESEQVAWWDPADAAKNPALRPEVKRTPWAAIKSAQIGSEDALAIRSTQGLVPVSRLFGIDSVGPTDGVSVAQFIAGPTTTPLAPEIRCKADDPDAEKPTGASPDNQPPLEHHGVPRGPVWDDGSAKYGHDIVWDPHLQQFRKPMSNRAPSQPGGPGMPLPSPGDGVPVHILLNISEPIPA